MFVTKKLTAEIISRFAISKNDTGSSEVQIALFTQYIKSLTHHMKLNGKDHQSKKGLLAFVVKRNRLLLYLKNNSYERYKILIKELQLKKV